MSQTGYTPIQLYYSTTASTAPTAGNLSSGELAINITDGKLFYKDNAGVVQTLATKATAISSVNNNGVVYVNSTGQATTNSALTFNGTNLATTGSVNIKTGSYMLRFYDATGATSRGYIWSTSTDFQLDTGSTAPLEFLINGSEGMRLTSTSLYTASGISVGIGTSSPSSYGKLAVLSGSTATTAFFDTTAATAYSASSSFAGPTLTLRTAANATGNAGGIRFASSANGALEGLFAWVQNASGYGDFVWQSYNGSYGERMRLDSSGNLGLGVTPSALWYSSSKAIQIGSSGAPYLAIAQQTTSTSDGYMMWGARLSGDRTFAYQTTGDAVSAYRQSGGVHAWFTAPSGTASNAITFTQVMTLDASGNLLVGTTSTSNTALGFRVTASATVPQVSVGVSATSNNYVLYNTTAAAFRFYVSDAGQINATSTSITAISDASLKQNVRDLETGLNEVMALKPRRFDWKEETKLGLTNVAGFIAQEVEEVLPELVQDYQYNENETKKSLKMGDILPTLVKAIQEQQAIIEELKSRLAAAGI